MGVINKLKRWYRTTLIKIMTLRKRYTEEELYKLSYYTPILVIIRRRGFYWVHEKTISDMGQQFHAILNAHNIIIKGQNIQLNLFKLVINAKQN